MGLSWAVTKYGLGVSRKDERHTEGTHRGTQRHTEAYRDTHTHRYTDSQ